jgi:hypothetical protein
MKKTFPAIVLLLVIGLTNAQASGGRNEHEPVTSKKSSTVVVQNILSDRLPSRLLNPIKKNYKDYWITDLNKKTGNGKTSYCITVENADKKITMNATPSGNWAVTRVITKGDL